MADNTNTVRQRIVASVFSRRNAAGSLEETYVSHVKIWEDAGPEGGGRKPRYILLSQASNGSGFIHKSKLNTNGSFSVGKTWRLAELRAVQVVSPTYFNITLSRTYKWETENAAEQAGFVAALVRLFRSVTNGTAALQIEGFPDPDAPGRQPPSRSESPAQRRVAQPSRPTTPSRSVRRGEDSRGGSPQQQPPDPRRLRRVDDERAPSPQRTADLRARTPSRPPSPSASSRSYTRERVPSNTSRPPSPGSEYQQGSVRPRGARRPSNAASTTSSRFGSSNATTPASFTSTMANMPTNGLTATRSNLDIPTTPMSAYPTSASPNRTRGPSPPTPNDYYEQTPRRAPSRAPEPPPAIDQATSSRRDYNARISYFDPANQATLDRLISGAGTNEGEGEEENSQAMMADVEEMLEGYEWASEDVIGNKPARGAADLIEARLLDELMALDKANIHSFLESDDRIGLVLGYMEEAIQELDAMDSIVSSYKIHLNTVGDDISYIQSQNRGLQVQTQNQRALLAELENLLQTVHVDREALTTLTQESLEKASSIQRLEEASAELYKALQAGRDRAMAATMERLQEYRTYNGQFCKRVFDFLSIMFTAQSKLLLGSNDGVEISKGRGRPALVQHKDMETYLGRYAGLLLYLKEMDESTYGKLCAAYFSAASELHSTQIKALMSMYMGFIKKAPDDEERDFGHTPTTGSKGSAMQRAGTLIRSPLDGRGKDKGQPRDGNLAAAEAFSMVLEQLAPQIYGEDDFITDFLQINDAGLTFADYMGLDNYFRRQATRTAAISQSTQKLIRGALELIFGFVPAELKTWIDTALAKDNMQIIGILASLERFLSDASDRGNTFLISTLEKQDTRLKALFERHVADQIKGIERSRVANKKRRGVVSFVKYFPTYVRRVENQLIGSEGLEIRSNVNAAYDKIVETMFESLKQMAKMDGEGEDKGQINYHVMLIENMHHFVAETSQVEMGSVAGFVRRAESVYDENLSAYVKLVLRRPFAKLIDYFEGVERLLKTTAPTEVSSNSTYNRSALKKVVKEYNVKDVRKHVDTLSKRVEKHFTDASDASTDTGGGGIAPGTVLVGVWKALEEELLRITELYSKRIAQCYADAGISLEYTASDVEGAFRRHRT